VKKLLAAALVLAAGPALAHTGAGLHDSIGAGVLHPILGTDHLLAMVAVGILAAAQGGRALWALPAAFVAGMAGGLGLGLGGLALPMLESVILASVIVLGAALALAARPPLLAGIVMAALFGVFHGTAHGSELGTAAALPFALGVLGATAFLHAAGVALGGLVLRLAGRPDAGLPLRFLGAGVGFGGVMLAFG
jgi:urease accessory protein